MRAASLPNSALTTRTLWCRFRCSRASFGRGGFADVRRPVARCWQDLPVVLRAPEDLARCGLSFMIQASSSGSMTMTANSFHRAVIRWLTCSWIAVAPGTAAPVGIEDDHGALVGPLIGAQQFVGRAVHPGVFRRRDDDILGRVEVELPAAQAAVACGSRPRKPRSTCSMPLSASEKHDVALAR